MKRSHPVISATKRPTVVGLTLMLAVVGVVFTEVCVSFQPLHHGSFVRTRTSASIDSRCIGNGREESHRCCGTNNHNNNRIGLNLSFGSNNNSNDDGCDGNGNGDNNGVFKSFVDRMSHQVAAFAAASLIFFSSGTAVMGPVPPAFAEVDADATTVSTTTASVTPEQQQESLLLKGVSREELAERAKEPTKGEFSSSVIDEVWTLLNKYYLDRSFNSQDWNDVRARAESKGEKIKFDEGKSMKIVTEMVQSLGDKYTRILDKDQYAAIQKFDLIGVGVTLMPNAQKDIIVGAPPIAGSASDKAGLKVGDFVTAVNGIPTRGRNAFDIIDQIGENPNAKQVSFSILRDKGPSTIDSIGNPQASETFVVTMERQTMEVKDPVQFKISETRSDGTKVGYVRVSEFNTLVNSSLQRALSELKKQGANAYVMDLRGNTGGAFQSAIEISSLFLRDRVATYVVDSNQVELPFRTPKLQDLSIDPETPLVVWIDGMSASASEVLAGSLHDNCRAVTMGEKSFGKGLIQAVYGLKNGAGLVVTVAKYITPDGSEIQGKGITPDVLPLGKNMPAPVYVPVLSTDTSKVDWQDVRERLSSKVCTVPEDRVAAKVPATGAVAEAASS
mmetsp:Transcript_2117/g.4755  ORF Transcript_2117/g.4755 Transcript_2117/m.4755 type:complete len:616 (-) Transcript_2117:34-1881(-)